MSTTTKKAQRMANVLESITQDAKQAQNKPKQKSVLLQSNDIAKQEYSFSQYWNKIQKDRNDCYISLAFHKLKDKDTLRSLNEVIEIPYFVITNHFLAFYNVEQRYPIKLEKVSWFTLSKFLYFVANLPQNKYNEILNFGLKHSPKKDN